ncbi:Uncharacterized conserved protein YbbK, DUF523 family [Ruminococcaceae bacterium YRB3002]|nr:Uncharacterized conserved protein YbbK, DUF523 family [Ruminococcaceae bacterium YRB3002]
MAKILVSACLLGVECRYKGDGCPCKNVIDLKDDNELIPVCPEQAGGLPTPRTPSERVGDKVIMRDGTDVTEQYKKGAGTALYLAKEFGVDYAILKANSPSCGKGMIYDGTFTGNKCAGNGVTAELLIANGIPVYTEDEISQVSS